MKPGTPLPWHEVSSLSVLVREDGHIEHDRLHDMRFARHAANAYPKLVHILKVIEVTRGLEEKYAHMLKDVRAVLHELGESEAANELWQRLNALSHRFGYDSPEARTLTEAALIVKAAGDSIRGGTDG